jgi:hypothetical protein
VPAERQAERAARRPKASMLTANPALCARVITDLQRLYSSPLR